jgi:hypothetical protein
MAGIEAGRAMRWALGFLAAAWTAVPSAHAIEAFDGRLQAHGFLEMQVRGLSSSFEEELDLAQWYNVVNVEVEFDVLPDGWGPFDLLQAYVRAEARYDAVYMGQQGFRPARSIDLYGNDSKRLPKRLRDALDQDYGGVIPTNDSADPPGVPPRVPDPNRDPTGWVNDTRVTNPVTSIVANPQNTFNPDLDPRVGTPQIPTPGPCPTNGLFGGADGDPTYECYTNRRTRFEIVKRAGFPGFDTLFDQNGADGELGPNPDYTNSVVPADPGGDVDSLPATPTTADFEPLFRGLVPERDDPAVYTFASVLDYKFTFRRQKGPDGSAGQTLLMGPWLPENFFDSLATASDRANPFRDRETPTLLFRNPFDSSQTGATSRSTATRYHVLDLQAGTFDPSTDCEGGPCSYGPDPVDPRLLKLERLTIAAQDASVTIAGTLPAFLGPYPNKFFGTTFGGDYSGIVAQNNTFTRRRAQGQLQQTPFVDNITVNATSSAGNTIPYTNVAVRGGSGELPMRPAPDLSNLSSLDLGVAQGLYLPSSGLLQELRTHDLDDHEFNFSQFDRSFNRGQSQSETYELKEAYLDMEFLDSRLWVRAGIQNIVWGKTELFRTTDQFNPQDLALASLPALEESRIAVLSARAVYSFYDIGPLNDVRLELAANFDRFKPADLGACGEPYTPDLVCQITAGLMVHGLTGVGLVGVDRPPSGWSDIDGVEFGGRIEFRWNRFSFAITDFYGYNDFPYPDPVFFYERNEDPSTGRMRRAGSRGPCENAGAVVRDIRTTAEEARGVAPFERVLHGGNSVLEFSERAKPVGERDADVITQTQPTGEFFNNRTNDDYSRTVEAHTVLGIGIDDGCLKPGGAAGGPAENRFDPARQPLLADFTDPLLYSNAGSNSAGNPNDPATQQTFVYQTLGQWSLAGSSVDFALEEQPGNQQLFAFLCSATVTIVVSLDPGACAFNIFGSDGGLIRGSAGEPIPFGDIVSVFMAGEMARVFHFQIIQTIVQNTKNDQLSTYPLVGLNSDIRDGRFNSTLADADGGARDDGFLGVGDRPYRDPDNWLTADSTLTAEQRALLGCGPFFGTRCDSSAVVSDVNIQGLPVTERVTLYGQGGGLDPLNADASAILQSFPGIEGTAPAVSLSVPVLGTDPALAPINNGSDQIDTWVTWSTDAQPGTIGFEGGPACTRFDPDSPFADASGIVKQPGCRGARSIAVNETLNRVEVEFEPFYTPRQDGCVFAPSIGGRPVVPVVRDPNTGDVQVDAALQAELDQTCFNQKDRLGNVWDPDNPTPLVNGDRQTGTDISLKSYHRVNDGARFASTASPAAAAGTLFHPFGGCVDAGPGLGGAQVFGVDLRFLCDFRVRDYEADFLAGNAQIFRSEMAALSWNFMIFLVLTSCNSVSGGDVLSDGDCFDPARAWEIDRCSYSQPYRCRNVKAFLGLGGVRRNDVRAGGTSRFGRRDFLWHSGGEATLRYARRNVFGFSLDFAEDVTKTNWGMEFTWIGETPFINNDSLSNITDSGVLNLTVSVDRPTFINFLNANRTFFMNTQWFFQYILDHEDGFTSQGPFNALFTFAVFTGYYQDRLLPQIVTVYDFRSRSGGFLPTIQYRFNDAFSVTFGVSFFVGRGEYVDMPVTGFAPASNRAGNHAYEDGVDRLLSLIRRRDEAFIRLRWTF